MHSLIPRRASLLNSLLIRQGHELAVRIFFFLGMLIKVRCACSPVVFAPSRDYGTQWILRTTIEHFGPTTTTPRQTGFNFGKV